MKDAMPLETAKTLQCQDVCDFFDHFEQLLEFELSAASRESNTGLIFCLQVQRIQDLSQFRVVTLYVY